MERDNGFSSKLSFIISSIGASIGLGIIWMFPFKLARYGGSAFLIPYFLFMVVLGCVGLIIEFTFGKVCNSGSLSGIRNFFKKHNIRGGMIVGLIPF